MINEALAIQIVSDINKLSQIIKSHSLSMNVKNTHYSFLDITLSLKQLSMSLIKYEGNEPDEVIIPLKKQIDLLSRHLRGSNDVNFLLEKLISDIMVNLLDPSLFVSQARGLSPVEKKGVVLSTPVDANVLRQKLLALSNNESNGYQRLSLFSFTPPSGYGSASEIRKKEDQSPKDCKTI